MTGQVIRNPALFVPDCAINRASTIIYGQCIVPRIVMIIRQLWTRECIILAGEAGSYPIGCGMVSSSRLRIHLEDMEWHK